MVILFNENSEVLLEERSDDGFFDFPGGSIDLKESAEDAAKRELYEETGLIADELERLDFNDLYAYAVDFVTDEDFDM